MREYAVTIPIAGHAIMTVAANNEDEAIEIALESVTLQNIESWEALEQFNQGNVCYCPQPWEAEAEDCGEIEPDPTPAPDPA